MTIAVSDSVVGPDGRRLGVHRVAGDPAAPTIVLCHPAPGSGLFNPVPEQTLARSVSLLAVDRPGYGGTDPLPEPTAAHIAASAADLIHVLDRCGLETIGLVGWGLGGLTALAVAAQAPALVSRLVLVGTPAPPTELPWLPAPLRDALAQHSAQPVAALLPALAQELAATVAATGQPLAALLGSLTPADQALLALPGPADRLDAMLQLAMRQGADGWAGDLLAAGGAPWDPAWTTVAAKTLLLYGGQDAMVGTRHGSWWQRRLPQARVEADPTGGALLLVSRWDRVLSHLAPGTKRAGGRTPGLPARDA